MSELELQRKTAQCCTRCGADLRFNSPDNDTGLCDTHREDLNARVAASKRLRRARRRATTQRSLLPASIDVAA